MSKNTKMTNISASIPTELAEKLTQYADKEERSKNYVIKKALEKFIAVDFSGRSETEIMLDEIYTKDAQILEALANV